MYICIEGNDGSGKDTQASLLCDWLRSEKGLNPLLVTEPDGDSPTGKLLRELLASGRYPESHAALFLADRMVLQKEKVIPALEEGRPVVSVRSFLSTLVYQQEHWPLEWLVDIHKQMPVKPDAMVYLDITPHMGLARVGRRGGEAEVYEKLEIQQRNRDRYLDIMQGETLFPMMSESKHRVLVNAAFSQQEVFKSILDGLGLEE